ncbi:four helix bundle protein [Patescibacteria group bacterium]|nr:four helix bundle protein [Patescibacteria group bacterium]MBU1890868.1 four helix bundle protein [Patescibacteria group bacterium]
MSIVKKQLIRYATSVGANLAEGSGGSSRKDFLYYLCISRKSCYETVYWLRIVNSRIDS